MTQLNQLMNHEGVCRSAPATPGLLNSTDIRMFVVVCVGFNNLARTKYSFNNVALQIPPLYLFTILTLILCVKKPTPYSLYSVA